MADIADLASDLIDATQEAAIAEHRRKASELTAGHPGECQYCGEESKRIVKEACAPCRDKYNLG